MPRQANVPGSLFPTTSASWRVDHLEVHELPILHPDYIEECLKRAGFELHGRGRDRRPDGELENSFRHFTLLDHGASIYVNEGRITATGLRNHYARTFEEAVPSTRPNPRSPQYPCWEGQNLFRLLNWIEMNYQRTRALDIAV